MILPKWNEQVHVFLICVLAFLIPAFPPALPILVVLLSLNWLLVPKAFVQGFKENYKNPNSLLLILLGIYLIGMLFTSNTGYGLETIEGKLSFLVFPFLVFTYTKACKENIFSYLRVFIYGTVANALFCFGWASYCYFKPVLVTLYGIPYDLGASNFYYNQLSFFFHPSYSALYCIFALISLVYMWSKGQLKMNWKWVAIIFLLVLFVLLLSSKAGWIGLSLFIIYFFIRLAKEKRAVMALLMLGTVVGLFIFLNIYFTPRFVKRIPELSTITHLIEDGAKTDSTARTGADGSVSRIMVWKAAIDIIRSNFWIGVGTGDAKDKMLEKYKEKDMKAALESKLNSHNQFLNTFIALGVTGFIVLSLCFLIPFYYSFKRRSFLLAAFICIVGLNFMVESMLETQAGVIFYSFFYSLLCITLIHKGDEKSKSEIA